MRRWLLSALALVVGAVAGVQADEAKCFPDSFLFGSATASYQVEGAVKEGGRTPSIWDDFCREKPGYVCANVADDFYHRFKSDIQMMVNDGLQSFRFSISWSRAMNWDAATSRFKPNAEGIAFYHALIDELNANHLEPILTLYHWDLPSELQTELSPPGWLNSEIQSHYVEYATLIFNEFGHKIKFWTTFNEPYSFVTQGYGTGAHAPGFTGSSTNTYAAAYNLLVSHAKAVKVFRDLRTVDSGVVRPDARIGIVNVAHYMYPLDPSNPKDVAAAERALQFDFGWFHLPIVTGDYPEVMKQRVGDRLPKFTEEESQLLKGSYDLFMLNHYASKLVTDCDSPTSETSCGKLTLGWEHDKGVDDSRMPEGGRRSSKDSAGNYNCAWFTAYPPGYLELIKWTHKYDTSAEILLTENGWCGNDQVDNLDQLWYYQNYLEQVHKAVSEEKIPVIGYTAWSFFDNYEWGSFQPRFGLYYVNFTSQTGSPDYFEAAPTDLTRIPRSSAKWFSQLSKTKCLPAADWSAAAPVATTSAPEVSTTSSPSDSGGLSPWTVVGIVVVVVAAVTLLGLGIRRFLQSRGSRSERTPLL
jgi:beta-glucosidase/6-phospho-beta-glucosidase/beta-galactosidase